MFRGRRRIKRKAKGCRHDSDDGIRRFVEMDGFSDDIGGRTKLALPQRMRHEDDVVRAIAIFFRGKVYGQVQA